MTGVQTCALPISVTTTAAALESAGLPVDWLAFFTPPGQGTIVDWLAAGNREAELSAATFTFRPSAPGFRLSSESGEEALAGLRVQLTRGDDWDRPGDGGSVDLVRQLVEGLPAIPIVASLEAGQLPAFLKSAGRWHWTEIGRAHV